MDTIQPVRARATIQSRPPMPHTNEAVPGIIDIVEQIEPPRPDAGSTLFLTSPMPLEEGISGQQTIFTIRVEEQRPDAGWSVSLFCPIPTPTPLPTPALTDLGIQAEFPRLNIDGSALGTHCLVGQSIKSPGATVVVQNRDNLITPESGSWFSTSGKWWFPNVLPAKTTPISSSPPRPDAGSSYFSHGGTNAPITPTRSLMVSADPPKPEVGGVLLELKYPVYQSSQFTKTITVSSESQRPDAGWGFYSYQLLGSNRIPPAIPELVNTESQRPDRGSVIFTSKFGKAPVNPLVGTTHVQNQPTDPVQAQDGLTLQSKVIGNAQASSVQTTAKQPEPHRPESGRSFSWYLASTRQPTPSISFISAEAPRPDAGNVFIHSVIPFFYQTATVTFIVSEPPRSEPGREIHLSGLPNPNQVFPAVAKIVGITDKTPETGQVITITGLEAAWYGRIKNTYIIYAENKLPEMGLGYSKEPVVNLPRPAPVPVLASNETLRLDLGYRIIDVGLLASNPASPGKVTIISKSDILPEDGRSYQSHAVFTFVNPLRAVPAVLQTVPISFGEGIALVWQTGLAGGLKPSSPTGGISSLVRTEERGPEPGSVILYGGYFSAGTPPFTVFYGPLFTLAAISYQPGSLAAKSISG